MEISEPIDVRQFFEEDNWPDGVSRIFFSEREGDDFSAITPPESGLIAVFGPKGGWDDAELAAARNARFAVVTFGGRIMRAETAAIAMTAILQHRFGDLS